jgi:hypothetical protein
VCNCIDLLAVIKATTIMKPVGSVCDVGVKFLAAAMAVIFFSSHAATAESLRDTLDHFGFFGRWALNCAEPASPDNNVRNARMSPAGDPIFSESLGVDGEPNIYLILRAKRTGPDTIVIRTKLNSDVEQELTMRRDGNRLRTVTNRDRADGHYIVRHGIVTSNKKQTPWLTRCDAIDDDKSESQ